MIKTDDRCKHGMIFGQCAYCKGYGVSETGASTGGVNTISVQSLQSSYLDESHPKNDRGYEYTMSSRINKLAS